MEALVFGGTSEGRAVIEWLAARRAWNVVACSATDYGAELVSGLANVEVVVGPLDEESKERLLAAHDFACIVDATHPYATHVTQSVARLAQRHGIPLMRLIREEQDVSACVQVADARAAARYVAARPGRILLTTGTNDLPVFAEEVPDFAERVFVRLLPVVDSLARARELGVPAAHILALQGPFSVELNRALMQEHSIETLVTKSSGAAGGFAEKVEAARLCGVRTVVIGRPRVEEGYSLAQVEAELARMEPEEADGSSAVDESCSPRQVAIIGAGMGGAGGLTREAYELVERSELVIASPRLLKSFDALQCEKRACLRTSEIIDALERSGAARVSVLFSGDVGFYSGATALREALGVREGLEVRVYPGVSAVQHFCARIGMPWEGLRLASAHGRSCDAAALLRQEGKVFFLTGGDTRASDICRQLADAGLGDAFVWVGERLTYPDEHVVSGTARELAGEDFSNLSVLVAKLPQAPAPLPEAGPGRILVASTSSGAGKTSFTCGLLRLLQRRGLAVRAFKCGPDYIDPMFHRSVLGIESRNLDSFMMGSKAISESVSSASSSCDIAVIEGAMGYYDGIAASDSASAWEVGRIAQASALLIVDAQGQARSVAAQVVGFTHLRADHGIAGIVLNRVSPSYYPLLKKAVEEESGIAVVGYVPKLADAQFASRHLGLVTADELPDLQAKVDAIADVLAETIDIDAVLEIAGVPAALSQGQSGRAAALDESHPARRADIRIAVARDEAFCFYYADALDVLRSLGAQLVEFSPINDKALPVGSCGLYLGGGYPELHARALSANGSMRDCIASAIRAGMPTIAECGGFMYLHETLEDDGGRGYPMAGVIPGRAFRTGKLSRFGYVELAARHDSLLAPAGGTLRCHEFHYWESDDPGSSFYAQKPLSARGWDCVHATHSLYAGFPHLCLQGSPEAARRFVYACRRWREEGEGR